VAATAPEAKSSRSLKYTAKNIALITTIVYLVVAVSFYLNVSWTDPLLVSLLNIIMRTSPTVVLPTSTTRTNIIPVIGLLNTHMPKLAGLVNGCLIMAVLSAANTDLYVASRTLFGLAREINPNIRFWGWVSKLGTITHNSKIPAVAVLVSAIAFSWLPFLHFISSYNDEKVCCSLLLQDNSYT
jgi:amino acid transporter